MQMKRRTYWLGVHGPSIPRQPAAVMQGSSAMAGGGEDEFKPRDSGGRKIQDPKIQNVTIFNGKDESQLMFTIV